MSNAELKEFMYAFKMEIKAELKAQATMIDKVVVPKIDELNEHQKEANHKVAQHEKRLNEKEWFCSAVQLAKEKSSKREKVKYITQIIISAFAAALMLQYGILEFLKLL